MGVSPLLTLLTEVSLIPNFNKFNGLCCCFLVLCTDMVSKVSAQPGPVAKGDWYQVEGTILRACALKT